MGDMCGIVGVYGHPEAAKIAWLSLHAQQHRGQEAAGIASSDGSILSKKQGLLTTALAIPFEVFSRGELPGNIAVGQIRYSTVNDTKTMPPLDSYIQIDGRRSPIVEAHNGNMTDEPRELENEIFQTSVDSEWIFHLIPKASGRTLEEKVVSAFSRLKPSYCHILSFDDILVAARDPSGVRPLSVARLTSHAAQNKTPTYVVASESIAFDILKNEGYTIEDVRDIQPGGVWFFSRDGVKVHSIPKQKELYPSHLPEELRNNRLLQCVFELVYFSHPSSKVFGYPVSTVKKMLGRVLAEEYLSSRGAEYLKTTDFINGVPDSGNHAALGMVQRYHELNMHLPSEYGLMRSHYIGRTFILPEQGMRDLGALMKFAADRSVVKGAHILLVDDSVVRGTNARRTVTILRNAGAERISFVVTYPLWKQYCQMGIETKRDSTLLGAQCLTNEDVARIIGADDFYALSMGGVFEALLRIEHEMGNHVTREELLGRFCRACTLPLKPT